MAAGWVFGALTQDVIAGEEAVRIDRPVLRWFAEHREPWLTTTAVRATTLGSFAVLLSAALLTGTVLASRRSRIGPLAYLLVTVGGAELLIRLVKALVGRPRPDAALQLVHARSSAFPSGHATGARATRVAVAIAVSVGWPWRRRTAAVAAAVAVAVLVGLTRLYLGVHWSTDVLAGLCLGGAWVTLTTLVFAPVLPRAPLEQPPVAERFPAVPVSG